MPGAACATRYFGAGPCCACASVPARARQSPPNPARNTAVTIRIATSTQTSLRDVRSPIVAARSTAAGGQSGMDLGMDLGGTHAKEGGMWTEKKAPALAE